MIASSQIKGIVIWFSRVYKYQSTWELYSTLLKLLTFAPLHFLIMVLGNGWGSKLYIGPLG